MSLIKKTGHFFFIWRDKLPIPLALVTLGCARPKVINWILGLPLVVLGEFVRLWALTHIGPKTRTRSICAENLITSGPYSHCRNPLYLGNTLKIVGIMTVAGNWILALLVGLFYLLEFATMIPYEEDFLADKFSLAHQKYREAVPAFVPTLKANPEFNKRPSFSFAEAIKSEKKTFLSTSTILSLILLISAFGKEKQA